MMKKWLLMGMLTAAMPAMAADMAQLKQEGRSIAKQFLGELKPELQKAMKSGGPVHAIDVCHKKAPQITAEMTERTGWDLKRTSLKVRNPENAPDTWEKAVMEKFVQQRAQGVSLSSWSMPKS